MALRNELQLKTLVKVQKYCYWVFCWLLISIGQFGKGHCTAGEIYFALQNIFVIMSVPHDQAI